MSLRQRVISGLKWTTLSNGIVTLLQLAQLSILARILSPADFGLMAIVSVIIGFASAFADMGISNAIVQRQNLTGPQLSSLYWTSIIAGLLIASIVGTSSPMLAMFYKEPRIGHLLTVGSIIFAVTPFGQQFQAILQKNLRFDLLARIEILSALAGTAAAISLGYCRIGIVSLIIGQLIAATTRTLLLVRHGWNHFRPQRPSIRREHLDGVIGFGLFQMGERMVNYLAANVDFLIVGRFCGPEALGTYMVSYNLATYPMAKVNPIITRVAFPVFAIKQAKNDELQDGYLKMTRMLAFIVFPLLAGLASTSQVLVPVLFGPRWVEAISLTQVLAILGALKAMGNPSGAILLAKGRPDIGFKWNVFVGIANIAIFSVAGRYGVTELAWAYVLASAGYSLIGQAILKATIGLGYRRYFSTLITPLLLSACMGASIQGILQLLTPLDLPGEVLLVLLISAGCGIYLVLCATLAPSIVRELKSYQVGEGRD